MFEFILCWYLLIDLGSALECGLYTQWDSLGWEWELTSTSQPQHWDPVWFEFLQTPTHANTVFLSLYVCQTWYICKTCKTGLSVPNRSLLAYCPAVSSCINPHLAQEKTIGRWLNLFYIFCVTLGHLYLTCSPMVSKWSQIITQVGSFFFDFWDRVLHCFWFLSCN